MRVLVVDDHALVRQTLARFLDSSDGVQVVGEAADGEEAVALAQRVLPDMVLMDIRMPGSGGMEAIRRIKRELPQVKVVALTVSDDVGDVVEAVRSGADGYLLKSETPEDLVSGLNRVMGGEATFSRSIASRVFREFARQAAAAGAPQGFTALSPREMEVLRMVADGATNKEIGARLSLSESTVRNHVHSVLAKLNLHSRFQAALFARSSGLFLARRAEA